MYGIRNKLQIVLALKFLVIDVEAGCGIFFVTNVLGDAHFVSGAQQCHWRSLVNFWLPELFCFRLSSRVGSIHRVEIRLLESTSVMHALVKPMLTSQRLTNCVSMWLNLPDKRSTCAVSLVPLPKHYSIYRLSRFLHCFDRLGHPCALGACRKHLESNVRLGLCISLWKVSVLSLNPTVHCDLRPRCVKERYTHSQLSWISVSSPGLSSNLQCCGRKAFQVEFQLHFVGSRNFRASRYIALGQFVMRLAPQQRTNTPACVWENIIVWRKTDHKWCL